MFRNSLNPHLKTQLSAFLGDKTKQTEPYVNLFRAISQIYDKFGITGDHLVDEKTVLHCKTHLDASQRIGKTGSWEMDLSVDDSSDPNGLKWSNEAYRIFGYEPGEVEVSLDFFFKHIPSGDHRIINRAYEEAVTSGTIYQVEHRIIRSDLSVRILMERGEFLVDPESGLPYKMIGTVQDITERKENESELKAAKANLQSIIENTDTAYILLDVNANIISFNQVAKLIVMTTVGRELVVGENYIQLILADRREKVQKHIQDAISKGIESNYKTCFVIPNGETRWFDIKYIPVKGEANQVLSLSLAVNDITERKASEDKLKLFNERYELMTRATNDVLWDWDLVNDTIYRSANYHQLFGYNASETNVYIESLIDPIHPDDKTKILQSVLEKIQDPFATYWEAEYRIFKNNGETAVVKDNGYIVRNEDKKPVRIVGAMHDITNSHAAELERERITRDLIRQNKDLEQFAYIVSHNLRAPVANIRGFAELMSTMSLTKEELDQILKGINVSVKNLDGVIQDLNTILQVKREVNEKREVVKFTRLVKDILIGINDQVKRERVKFNLDFAEISQVFSVKSYLHSIFYNLISNSIKYKRPDHLTVINIKSQILENKVVLTFEDNGLGIDLKSKGDQVFGLYKRFHHNMEGKGMGLFMVKTQVEAIGGKISIESEVNKGTKFSIELSQ
jgi:PAS domain S-box-containing protein